ncbi:MAG TPA: hypothetical protein VD931_02905 [Baekduia sp.]|nr:hypothetical protein [Baekduia sp.]
MKIEWSASGYFQTALVPAARRDAMIASEIQGAQAQAVRSYLTGRMSPNIFDRLKPGAFFTYDFTPRSEAYRKRQRRILGEERPYHSPRRRNFAKLATAIGQRNPMAIIRALDEINGRQAHMSEILRRPGAYSLKPAKGARIAQTAWTLPGAKILNRVKDTYRRQFTDLSRGGGRDARAILELYADLVGPRVARLITGPRPRRLRIVQ